MSLLPRSILLFAVGFSAATAAVVPAQAAVVDKSDTGFTARVTLEIAAPPSQVYDALTADVAQWWNPAHTWSGDAANLSLDARAGGLFAESLPGGGSVEHMRVLYAAPGALLRLGGGLGPLQGMAVTGSLSVELMEKGAGTSLVMTYAVTGYAPGGLDKLAAPVDGVLQEQMERLAAYAIR